MFRDKSEETDIRDVSRKKTETCQEKAKRSGIDPDIERRSRFASGSLKLAVGTEVEDIVVISRPARQMDSTRFGASANDFLSEIKPHGMYVMSQYITPFHSPEQLWIVRRDTRMRQ